MYKTPRPFEKLSINSSVLFVYKVIGIKTIDEAKLVKTSNSNGL